MPRDRWYNYLVGGILGFLLVFTLTRAIWPFVYNLINQKSSIKYFIGVNLTFIPIILAIIVVIIFYHNFSFKNFVNSKRSIQYKRIVMGFTVWILLQFISLLISYIFNKDSLTYNFNPSRFLVFLLLSLIFTPIQVASEELLFRGYLIKGLQSIKKGMLFPLILSATLFALPHLSNPEVKGDKFLFFLIYSSMALLFGYLTLKYKGLEYSFGVHFANNFFAINFVNYPDSPLPSSPFFLIKTSIEPLPTLLQTVIFGLLLIIIIKKIEKIHYQTPKK